MSTRCPDVHFAFLIDDVGGVPEIEVTCNPNGTASVTIRIRVVNTTARLVFCRAHCGPGGVMEGPSMTPGGTPGTTFEFSFTCRYDTPSAPTPFVEVLDEHFLWTSHD